MRVFDPARDGFGFHNPVGEVAVGSTRGPLLRRLGAILYGNGLCFGMVAMSLRSFLERSAVPLAGLPPSPQVLGEIRRYHVRQYMPQPVVAAVIEWLRAEGGRPGGVPGRLRIVGSGSNPHLLCFGPTLNRKFFWCLRRAHAVAPYRVQNVAGETRVYVYDPNHPGDRERYVVFRRDESGRVGEFGYEGFETSSGWGISLFPLSAIGDTVQFRQRALP